MLAEWSTFGLFASVFAMLLFSRQLLYKWLQVSALSVININLVRLSCLSNDTCNALKAVSPFDS